MPQRANEGRGDEQATPFRVVMLGPPGAGKGTQGERLAKERGVPRIATGDILRDAAFRETESGRSARTLMDAGRLVSDEMVIGIVRDRLRQRDAAAGFVLDGFPRTLAQAEALDTVVDGSGPLVVVDIEVPAETLVQRLAIRRICGTCGRTAPAADVRCARCGGALVQRTDDDVMVVRERLRVYTWSTRPIVEFYRKRPTFRAVDGNQAPESVAADIEKALASVRGEAR